MPLKALLVDDDILVRVGLRILIDWPQAGWEIAGEAGNGLQALEMVESLKPDLLIMDMKMPQMDGAELLKRLRQRDKKMKIVVLSCYDDYNYMKEALATGANEYILKTELNRELLSDALLRIGGQIRDEERRDKEYYELVKQAAFHSYIGQETFYRELMEGRYGSAAEVEEARRQYGVAAEGNCRCILIFAARELGPPDADCRDKGKWEAVGHSLLNIIQGLLQSCEASPLLKDKAGSCRAVLYGTDEALLMKECEAVANKAIQAAELYTQTSLSVAGSRPSGDDLKLPESCRQAEEALKYRLLPGGRRIFFHASLPADECHLRERMRALQEPIQELFACLADGEEESCRQRLEAIFAKAGESNSMRLLRAVCGELCGWYNNGLHQASLDERQPAHARVLNAEDLLASAPDLAGLAREYVGRCLELLPWTLPNMRSIAMPAVRKAVEYIHSHYELPIGLTELSEHVGVSRSHLSCVFREQTGYNFAQYLSDYRIERAKHLLRSECYKIYEVASKVGFDNEKYFSQVFRAREGVTPTEYKRGMTN